MPCFFPLQASFSIRADGKKDISFSKPAQALFLSGVKPVGDYISLPCGRCIGCRLERSRQWAVRIMHEASLYEDNCFLTLTFDPEHLSSMCPTGSLDRSHMQNFLKRLRQKFSAVKIRTFYCGEYGELMGRPHYHMCLFNLDFKDKVLEFVSNGFRYYSSVLLSSVWPFGYCVISDLTFDSAAYVARYCVKKVNGDDAQQHYGGRLPEFCQASLKPGIGSAWLDKHGETDCFARDEIVVDGVKCKPPRYYDKRFERDDPARFERVKQARVKRAIEHADDATFKRLVVREKCLKVRFNKLVRKLERL